MRRIYRNKVIDKDAPAYASVSYVHSDGETYDMDVMRLPCPACPDGNEWGMNGPTGRACRVCGGNAYIVPGTREPQR